MTGLRRWAEAPVMVTQEAQQRWRRSALEHSPPLMELREEASIWRLLRLPNVRGLDPQSRASRPLSSRPPTCRRARLHEVHLAPCLLPSLSRLGEQGGGRGAEEEEEDP